MENIELAEPRVLTIKDRGNDFTLRVSRIPSKPWKRYFEGILSTSEMIDGKRVDSYDSSAARLELLEGQLLDATGYGSLEAVVDWRQKLPLSHRLAASNLLVAVSSAEPPNESRIALGAETVYLSAVWGADQAGKMRKFSGLEHRFRTPSAEHQRTFSRAASRSRIVGGSRQGKTVWIGAQQALMDLYDELIQAVEGYEVHGKPLGEDRASIVEWMDGYHKVAAADRLFSPAAVGVDDEGE